MGADAIEIVASPGIRLSLTKTSNVIAVSSSVTPESSIDRTSGSRELTDIDSVLAYARLIAEYTRLVVLV